MQLKVRQIYIFQIEMPKKGSHYVMSASTKKKISIANLGRKFPISELEKQGKRRCYTCNSIFDLTKDFFHATNKKSNAGFRYECRNCCAIKAKTSNIKRRKLVLNYYGGNPASCACCSERNYEFLAIDHINGGGNKHLKEVGQNLAYWLISNNFPEGFQVLCHNCNMAKGLYGYCPHKILPQ